MATNSYGSSFPEQVVYHFVKHYFLDAENRIKINGVEADIFIPSLNCVIEIDGGFWHENKADADNRKNAFFNDLDIPVLRIREKGLPKLKPFNGVVIGGNFSDSMTDLLDCIRLLFGVIADYFVDGELKETLSNYNPRNWEILETLPDAVFVLFPEEVHPNVLDYDGGHMWDYEKNGRLNPKNVNLENIRNIKLYFKCPEENPKKRRRTTCLQHLRNWCTDPNRINPYDINALKKYEWRKANCSYVEACHQFCSLSNDYALYLIRNRIPLNDYYHYHDKTCDLVLANFDEVVSAVLSPDCPSDFIDSIRKLRKKRNYTPPNTGTSEEQKKRFDEAIKITNW